jgi:hypothetical protein
LPHRVSWPNIKNLVFFLVWALVDGEREREGKKEREREREREGRETEDWQEIKVVQRDVFLWAAVTTRRKSQHVDRMSLIFSRMQYKA